ncbi:MAG: TolC family protein, partial [Bacteroidota bacterium]
ILPVQTQSLADLRQDIYQNNPSLAMLRSTHAADLERIGQTGQLPQPELGLGAFPLPVATRLGAQQFRLSATQQLPWWGLRQQERKLTQARAASTYERINARAQTLFHQAEQAYFSLYELQRSQRIIAERMALLQSLEQLSLARVENGTATAADVLRVQLKISAQEQELAILATQIAGPLATLNQLRNRELTTPVTLTDSLSFAILPFAKDTLLAHLRNHHPEIRRLAKQQEAAQIAIDLNTLHAKPKFGIGLDYIAVGERDDVLLDNNGRDILQLRGTVAIPIFREQYAAKEREERLRIQALDQQKTATANQFAAQIEQAYAAYETARLRLELYTEQLGLTDAALRILSASYRSNGSDFAELLRLEEERIQLQLEQLSAIVESHQAVSTIQQFILNNEL